MSRKLYIINNGLKDLRGHYFETSVSIAEAGRSLGLHPILAAHVTCPRDLAPDGIEFHPIFTTDHWMCAAPPPQPDRRGLRGDLAPLVAAPIEALRSGTIRFDEYIAARLLASHDPAGAAIPFAGIPPTGRVRLARQQLKRTVKSVLPPAVLSAYHRAKALHPRAKALHPRAKALYPRAKALLRQLTPPFVWSRLGGLRLGRSHGPGAGASAPLDPMAALLTGAGCPWEQGYCNRFGEDLERLLTLTGCSPRDHVLLPTAHGRELGAILDLFAKLPPGQAPTFHLEFRHDLGMSPDGTFGHENLYGKIHAAFFAYARRFPVDDQLRLYTDTDGLSEEYSRLSGLEFGVLPIPFRTRLLSRREREGEPLCLSFIGDMRDEKGFHWLPDLIDDLGEEVRSGRVRFLIQASLRDPGYNPASARALERLRAYPPGSVRLVGLDGPLAPDVYYRVVSQTDVLLCPYDPSIYRNRSSGTLAEAIAAGVPTVVPRGSWLSRQQPPGSGETFTDRASFIAAVRSICEDYSTYHSRARAGRHLWLDHHCPERLVRCLLGETTEAKSSAGKVA